MNILIIGQPCENIINAIQCSKLLDKLYIADSYKSRTIPNFEFESIEELAQKSKALQIDIAINLSADLINKNICEEFKQNKINLLSVNKKWLNLEINQLAAKQLLNHYSINTPQILKVPLKFPVAIKTKEKEIIATSMQEAVSAIEDLKEKHYLEECLIGEEFDLLSLWDGKNIYYFNLPENINEIKEDRLNLLKTKLTFMFSDEKADFKGFFSTRLIWTKNDWYVKAFSMGLNEKSALNKTKTDFLYILNSAIYQKLNEL